MGYRDYASFSLEKTMAKTTDGVYSFLKQLIASYKPKADAETKAALADIQLFPAATIAEALKLAMPRQ